MAVPSITALKMWVGTLFTKDDWDFNFSQIVEWLSGGSGDLVVNTIKTTNGLDMDGAQIINLGTATTGSQAINLDQALTLLNRTSYYYPFSVASGKVDSNGNAAFLQKDSDTQVTVLAGNVNPDLVCIQSDGTIESITANTVLTVPSTDGTYHIIKEKEQDISITSGSSGKVTIDKIFPGSQNIGDYFLDNSVVPFKGYKYTASGWEETPFCYLGYVTVESGTATVTTSNYNNNRYDVILTESYKNGASWYRVYSDGWCEQGGMIPDASPSATTVALLKNYKDTDYLISLTSYLPTASGNPVGVVEIHPDKAVDSFKAYDTNWSGLSGRGGYWVTKGYIY